MIAKKSKYVYSVEIVKEASKSAENLCKDNQIDNMKVVNGDCAKVLPSIVKEIKGDFSIVLDPARVGCDENVLNVAKLANKIIYISCNPRTLAKDLKQLNLTHEIKEVKPYDMFPQTKHIETLAILERV